MIWASDFPHNDAKYPGVVDELREHNGDLPDDARRALFGSTRSPVRHRTCRRLTYDVRPPDPRRHASSTAPVPPSRTADVAIADGTIVADRSRRRRAPTRTIDADGLLVTPGFVDIHTHYDAQLHWDPTASPASWHGVTTLLTGNCGFTLAPAEARGRRRGSSQMLSRVEGMSAEALAAGVDVRGRELRRLPRQRSTAASASTWARTSDTARCAATSWATTRRSARATDDEIDRDAGPRARRDARRRDRASRRHSWSCTSRTTGAGVPSNHAAPDELVALAGVLAEFGRGSIEFIPRSFLVGYDDADRELICAMARGVAVGRCTSTR